MNVFTFFFAPLPHYPWPMSDSEHMKHITSFSWALFLGILIAASFWLSHWFLLLTRTLIYFYIPGDMNGVEILLL